MYTYCLKPFLQLVMPFCLRRVDSEIKEIIFGVYHKGLLSHIETDRRFHVC